MNSELFDIDNVKPELHFKDWYKQYPNKKGSDKAETAYLKVLASNRATELELKQGLYRYIQHINATGLEKKFILMPATWLNQGHWKNEYTEQHAPVKTVCSDEEQMEEENKTRPAGQKIVKHDGFILDPLREPSIYEGSCLPWYEHFKGYTPASEIALAAYNKEKGIT